MSLKPRPKLWQSVQSAPSRLLPLLFDEAAPLDLRMVGRTLFHAALVGAATGLCGALFFTLLEKAQHLLLVELVGYVPLRASGEVLAQLKEGRPFRPWLLILLPALGGLATGLITRLAPETRGGGGDAAIEAFHQHHGVIRRRVIPVKLLASLFTLGTGGAGGREGPTMQIGGALGSTVGRLLGVSEKERRVLLVSGIAGGISAVFRTPLGAALLAVEVLYRDGFESDALIPSVLASVVSYSAVISVYGESTLFSHAPRFPFVPAHLPLFGLLAVLAAGLGALFVAALRRSQRTFRGLPLPDWARPALGGLLLGLFCTGATLAVDARIHSPGQQLGILGGGYGAVQLAISGASWLPGGWDAVRLLLLLACAKILASSLTIGSGGSAGDFAPSLAIGGLLGGAFGRAAQLLLHDPRLDPGAFALVGMGAFYGGIGHVPLSALVLVCELAGNYDLLVPLMLALAISFAALRRVSLYHAQAESPMRPGPAHELRPLLPTGGVRLGDLLHGKARPAALTPQTPASELLRLPAEGRPRHLPVLDGEGRLVGLVDLALLGQSTAELREVPWLLTSDVMEPPTAAQADDQPQRAAQLMLSHGLRELPVIDGEGRLVGLLGEQELGQALLARAPQ